MDPKKLRKDSGFPQDLDQNITCNGAHMHYRARLAFLAVVGALATPSLARADVITFAGCGQTLPEACVTITMTGTAATGFDGTPSANFGLRYTTPSGATFSLFDAFSWSLPDGTCVGDDSSPEFRPASCAATNASSMVVVGSLLYSPPGTNPILPTERSSITFTTVAAPEPATLALVAIGLLAIGGVACRRAVRPSRARVALALLPLLIACGSDSTGPTAVNVVGTFTLKTINGSGLPYVASQSGTSKTEIVSDQLTLNADGTFSQVGSVRVTTGATVATTQTGAIGVYQSANGQVSFTQTTPTSLSYSGSVSGNTLTAIAGGNTLVYQR